MARDRKSYVAAIVNRSNRVSRAGRIATTFGKPLAKSAMDAVAKRYAKRVAVVTATSRRRGAPRRSYAPNRPSVPFKHTIKKSTNRKYAKGISPSFQRKVQKVINFSKNSGRYTYVTSVQLRQAVIDSYGVLVNDNNGLAMTSFAPLQLLDAASILYNSKTPSNNWVLTTNNLDDKTKINCISCYSQMFFKSTSNHVVNLQVYECTAKVSQSAEVGDLLTQSYADTKTRYADFSNSNQASSQLKLGSTPKEWVELYKHFNVKCHSVKLLPGATSSLFFQGPKNRTVDLSQHTTNDNLDDYAKGVTKSFFVRVINDATVSAVATQKVHHWPSNEYGGVACRIDTVYNIVPPDNAGVTVESLNANMIGMWLPIRDTETDQQVTDHTIGANPQ